MRATALPPAPARARALKVASAPAARVLTTKSALTPPMVTRAVTLPPRVALAVTLTATVWPLRMVSPLNAEPSTMREPLVTLMLATVLMPLTVMVSLVTTVPGATSLRAAKLKPAGVVSAAVTVRGKARVAVSPAAVLPSASRTVRVYWAAAAARLGMPLMVPPWVSPCAGVV